MEASGDFIPCSSSDEEDAYEYNDGALEDIKENAISENASEVQCVPNKIDIVPVTKATRTFNNQPSSAIGQSHEDEADNDESASQESEGLQVDDSQLSIGEGSVTLDNALPRIRSSYLQRRIAWDLEEELAEQNIVPADDGEYTVKEDSVDSTNSSFGEMRQKELDFSGRCLDCVPEKVCKIRMLTKLDLSNNAITTLPEALGSLSLLQELYLNSNQLTSKVESMSSSMMSMLSSSHSVFSKASPARPSGRCSDFSVLAKLKNLEVLDLSNNRLFSSPEEVSKLVNIRILSLSNNHITSLPDLKPLRMIERLNVECNSLVSLPESISSLVNLVAFIAYDNQIQEIHPALRFPPSLVTLDLSRNFITSVHPKHFKCLRKLRELHLSGNQISFLDEELFFAPEESHLMDTSQYFDDNCPWYANLESLHLSDNCIKHLPSSIGRLANLSMLNINRNGLESLPGEIEGLTHLKDFYACGNKLGSLPSSFGCMYSLLYVDLSDNKLEYLPVTVGDLHYLRRLKLRHNRLVELPPELGSLPNLTDLDLYNNQQLVSPPPDVCAKGLGEIMSFLKSLPPSVSPNELDVGWQILKLSSSNNEVEVAEEDGEEQEQGDEHEDDVALKNEAEPEMVGVQPEEADDGSLVWRAASSAGWVILGITTTITGLAFGKRVIT